MFTLNNHKVWVYDVEVFKNYFLATFFNGETWKVYENIKALSADLTASGLCLCGFNNLKYDDIIIGHIANNPNCSTMDLYNLSASIINDSNKDLLFALTYAPRPWALSIDVFQLLNAKVSLKELECRHAMDNVMESGCDFNAPLDMTKVEDIKKYCRNDVQATYNLMSKHWELVTLRTTLKDMFGLSNGIYCMSEQGVAQHTFLTLHGKRTGQRSNEVRINAQSNPDNNRMSFPLSEIISNRVSFKTDSFKTLLKDFNSGKIQRNEGENWKLVIPNVGDTVTVAEKQFAIGVGGLHSVDGPGVFRKTDDKVIVDLDVASYYPSIIINENLYPKQIGEGFVDDMRTLRDLRLDAKRRGDKVIANALKIVINATFGKLDDAYSPLRSAPDAKRVTINGQLFLFMLIESLYLKGATILSANTDGVTIQCSKEFERNELTNIISEWQTSTGYELERAEYKMYARKDVNNYVAISTEGKVKTKGDFENPKNDGKIVTTAVVKYLIENIPVEVTINACKDIKQFLYYMRCKANSVLCFDKRPIGRSLRWYVSHMGGRIERHNPTAKAKWTKLEHGESGSLANEVYNGFRFEDLDRDYYISEANKLIRSIECL